MGYSFYIIVHLLGCKCMSLQLYLETAVSMSFLMCRSLPMVHTHFCDDVQSPLTQNVIMSYCGPKFSLSLFPNFISCEIFQLYGINHMHKTLCICTN